MGAGRQPCSQGASVPAMDWGPWSPQAQQRCLCCGGVTSAPGPRGAAGRQEPVTCFLVGPVPSLPRAGLAGGPSAGRPAVLVS